MYHRIYSYDRSFDRKGYAYKSGGNIYFDTSRLQEYYVFSSQSEKELLVGVRDDVDVDENKKK